MTSVRKQRLMKIERTKAQQIAALHVEVSGERRKLRAALGSRKSRKMGTKGHSNRARHALKLSPKPRLRLQALVDKTFNERAAKLP